MNIAKRLFGLDKPETKIEEVPEEVNQEIETLPEIEKVVFHESVLEEE